MHMLLQLTVRNFRMKHNLVLITLFAAFAAMAAIPAWAQAICDYPTIVRGAAPNPLPPVDCSQMKLTGEQFLDIFYAIAMHGDLTDIPFIEQTIGNKLPIHGSLNVNDGKTPPYKNV